MDTGHAGVATDSFVGMGLVALLLLGGLVTLVVLLANPKTRGVGVALLSAGAALVVAVVVVVGYWGLARVRSQEERQMAVESRTEAEKHAMEAAAAAEASPPTIELEATDAATADGQSEGVLRAMMKALGRAVADTKEIEKAARATAAGRTPTPPATASADESPAPPSRPAWVDSPSEFVIQDRQRGAFSLHFKEKAGDAYRMTVQIEPRRTLQECESELPGALNKAAVEFAVFKLNQPAHIAQRMQLPPDFLDRYVKKETYAETVHVSVGDWTQLHVLLEFDGEARARIDRECDRECDRFVVAGRLWYTSAGVAAGLALLAVAFGFLKIDLATGGSCRGRLSLGAAAAVLTVAAGTYLAVAHANGPALGTEAVSPAEKLVEPAPDASPAAVQASSASGGTSISVGPAELLIVIVAGAYVLILTTLSRMRWAWVLGFIACLVVGMAATPADPLSMFLVVIPLCILYTIAVFAKKSGSAVAAMGRPGPVDDKIPSSQPGRRLADG